MMALPWILSRKPSLSVLSGLWYNATHDQANWRLTWADVELDASPVATPNAVKHHNRTP